jgi:hypothetical protein
VEQNPSQAGRMNWSHEQQRLLGALGYELLIMASTPAAEPQDVIAARAEPFAHAVRDVQADSAGGVAQFPKLLQALRRAAGDRDVSGLIADVERLRREPALKRALWPQLRSLRRSH